MLVDVQATDDWTVEGPNSKIDKILSRARPHIASLLTNMLRTKNSIIHSPAIFNSKLVSRINKSDADIVHLHWVQGEMLSIADIARINKKIIWTLHDMWAFCGAEHIAWDNRWHEGYRRDNRPAHESGFDLNYSTFKRKQKHWHHPMRIVTPSQWLGDCVHKSALMKDWPISVIPNCLNTEYWKPMAQEVARELLRLPSDVPLIAFGSHKANTAHHKGFDLLVDSLTLLRGEIKGLELVIFGQLAPRNPPDLGFSVHYTGYLNDDLSLRAIYSAADAVLVPSRIEAFGQTAAEAHACGSPVIAFDIGGLSDIVEHMRTGYLAKAFNVEDFATGISWVLNMCEIRQLKEEARNKALTCFSNSVVAEQYLRLYQHALHGR